LYRDNIVKLDDGDPELERAWQTFPDPDADCHGFTWEYLATELIHEQWIHVFIHELHRLELRPVYARVPGKPGWNP